jgi:hypothetical protein
VKGFDLVVDTNLLVLFVVGMTNRNLVAKHKRLRAFSLDDFDMLCRIIASSRQVLVTPNTLTETSNLLGHIDEPGRSRVFETFRAVIRSTTEEYVESRTACGAKEFLRIGLADSGLLEVAGKSRILLTADLDLYLCALSRGLTVQNFNHLRDLAQPL